MFAVADEFEKDHGIPNIVINNAAGNFIAPSERLSPKGFNTVTSIVLQGTFNVTSAFGKKMIDGNTGTELLKIHVSTYTLLLFHNLFELSFLKVLNICI